MGGWSALACYAMSSGHRELYYVFQGVVRPTVVQLAASPRSCLLDRQQPTREGEGERHSDIMQNLAVH